LQQKFELKRVSLNLIVIQLVTSTFEGKVSGRIARRARILKADSLGRIAAALYNGEQYALLHGDKRAR